MVRDDDFLLGWRMGGWRNMRERWEGGWCELRLCGKGDWVCIYIYILPTQSDTMT